MIRVDVCADVDLPMSRDADEFSDDVTTKVAGSSRVRTLEAALVVIDGASRGARAELGGGLVKIGTAAGCELRIDDRTASRVHCEVRVRSNSIFVRDLGSTNGTWCEGVRIYEAEVPSGAMLKIGATTVRVDVSDAPLFVDVSSRESFGELVGKSVEMRRLYATLERVASSDTTVLVQGETGTGKDVLARSIHAESSRARGPFVPVDCGAVPEQLFESELFGHQKGSFTGATSDRKGVFEEAEGGTLFLDEVGELPLALQAKLLRALETKSVRRVGSNTPRTVDVRIIAATNRPLARCVNDGTFREDLYYRFAVVEVTLPPLRARREDIPLLAAHFYAALGGKGAPPEAYVAALAQRSYAGNVRELRNVIERDVLLGNVAAARPSTPPPAMASLSGGAEELAALQMPLKDARQAWTESFEQIYVRAVLKRSRGNVTRAAELAGVSRRFLQRMAARLRIKASEVGADPKDLDGDDDE
jgi:transcriptional regulator with PAS, ATPase and Fis domain